MTVTEGRRKGNAREKGQIRAGNEDSVVGHDGPRGGLDEEKQTSREVCCWRALCLSAIHSGASGCCGDDDV